MEGLFRLLLVAGLLAAVLPAAAATFGPQPGAPCEPTLLATQVALFCAPDMPTAQCCEPVVAAVDLGGGVPCLCRVAAEPQLVMAGLNATHLLTLYTSCGGLRPGGAHLAAACEGPAPPAAVVSAPPPSPGPRRKQPAHEEPLPLPSTVKPSLHLKHLGKNPGTNGCPAAIQYGTEVAVQCGLEISEIDCCNALINSINPAKNLICICMLSDQENMKQVGFNDSSIIYSYASCLGIEPSDIQFPSEGCAAVVTGVSGPSPSQSASSTSPPPAGRKELDSAPHSSKSKRTLVAILLGALTFVLILGVATVALIFWKKGYNGWVIVRADNGDDIELTSGQHDSDSPDLAGLDEQAEVLRRASERLRGVPAGPGLPDTRGHSRNCSV